MKVYGCLILSFHDRAVQHEWFTEEAQKHHLNLHKVDRLRHKYDVKEQNPIFSRVSRHKKNKNNQHVAKKNELLSDADLREQLIDDGFKGVANKFNMNLYFRKSLTLYNYHD